MRWLLVQWGGITSSKHRGAMPAEPILALGPIYSNGFRANYNKLLFFISDLMDYFLAGADQQQTY